MPDFTTMTVTQTLEYLAEHGITANTAPASPLPSNSNPFNKAVTSGAVVTVLAPDANRDRAVIFNSGSKSCALSNSNSVTYPSGDASTLILPAGGVLELDQESGSQLGWYAITNSTGSETTTLTGIGPTSA